MIDIDAEDDGTLHSIEVTEPVEWTDELVLAAAKERILVLGIAGEWSEDGRKFVAS